MEIAMLIIEQELAKWPKIRVPLSISREFANAAVLHLETGGPPMTYQQLMKHPHVRDDWSHSSANKLGRLAQGIGGQINGTNTIQFISKMTVPPD